MKTLPESSAQTMLVPCSLCHSCISQMAQSLLGIKLTAFSSFLVLISFVETVPSERATTMVNWSSHLAL